MFEQVQLKDGTAAWISPLLREDRDLLAAGFEELSAETKRQRFLAPVKHLSEAMLHHLVDDVDGVNHVALVLSAETSPDVFDPVAIARMVRYPDATDTADVAVTVKDSWQGRGIATALLAALVRHRPEGVTRLVTEVAGTNAASLAMLRRLGPTTVAPNGTGAYDVEVELDAARQTRGPTSEPAEKDARVALVSPSEHARPRVDRQSHQILQTRDLVCPWLN